MNWKLTKEENNTRFYIQEKTGSELQTQVIYTDQMGNRWFGFVDLFKMPYLRIAYSKQISDFYSSGVTMEDLDKWDNEELTILKSNDAEKYEKLYSIVLARRQARKAVADPIQKHLALCTVYVLGENDRIDYFDMQIAEKNMSLWKLDADAASFFLSWHLDRMANYTNNLNSTSQIVSKANL